MTTPTPSATSPTSTTPDYKDYKDIPIMERCFLHGDNLYPYLCPVRITKLADGSDPKDQCLVGITGKVVPRVDALPQPQWPQRASIGLFVDALHTKATGHALYINLLVGDEIEVVGPPPKNFRVYAKRDATAAPVPTSNK